MDDSSREQPAAQAEVNAPNESAGDAQVLRQLAGVLAHQIRNPLGAISNALALLRRHLPADCDELLKQAVAIAQEEVWVANRAISDLLEYARIEPPMRGTTSVKRLIDLALQSDSTSKPVNAIRNETDHLLYVDEQQVTGAIARVVRHGLDLAGSAKPVIFSSHVSEDSVEIMIDIEGAVPPPAPLDSAGKVQPLASDALAWTTAHALIANQGGRLENDLTSAARFRLVFPIVEGITSVPPSSRG
ncbi:MAG TPA: histidine kinase dimerization/phospho-acceptor domain-containing protein [Polyangiaceae bacterium]|nr:histidine kinase dimerization/phospho-acceptor domain-containing protein [Polyangiaceae bacterium]